MQPQDVTPTTDSQPAAPPAEAPVPATPSTPEPVPVRDWPANDSKAAPQPGVAGPMPTTAKKSKMPMIMLGMLALLIVLVVVYKFVKK